MQVQIAVLLAPLDLVTLHRDHLGLVALLGDLDLDALLVRRELEAQGRAALVGPIHEHVHAPGEGLDQDAIGQGLELDLQLLTRLDPPQVVKPRPIAVQLHLHGLGLAPLGEAHLGWRDPTEILVVEEDLPAGGLGDHLREHTVLTGWHLTDIRRGGGVAGGRGVRDVRDLSSGPRVPRARFNRDGVGVGVGRRRVHGRGLPPSPAGCLGRLRRIAGVQVIGRRRDQHQHQGDHQHLEPTPAARLPLAGGCVGGRGLGRARHLGCGFLFGFLLRLLRRLGDGARSAALLAGGALFLLLLALLLALLPLLLSDRRVGGLARRLLFLGSLASLFGRLLTRLFGGLRCLFLFSLLLLGSVGRFLVFLVFLVRLDSPSFSVPPLLLVSLRLRPIGSGRFLGRRWLVLGARRSGLDVGLLGLG